MRYTTILLICFVLSGCGYNKSTFVQMKGDKVRVKVTGICSVEGDNVVGTVNRQVNLTFEKGKKLKIQKNFGDNKETVNIE